MALEQMDGALESASKDSTRAFNRVCRDVLPSSLAQVQFQAHVKMPLCSPLALLMVSPMGCDTVSRRQPEVSM
jgi:hypothetical protein